MNVTRNQELVLLACRHCCGDYFTNQNTAKLAAVFALMLARHKMDRPRVELQIEDLIAAGVIELLHKDSGTRVRLTTEACRILGGGSAEPQIPLVPYWELEQEQRQALKTSPKRFREWYLAWLSDPAQRDAVMRNGRDWSPVVVAIVDTAIDMSEIDAIQIERLFKRTAERGFSRQETQRALGELAAVEKIAFRRGQSGRVFVLLMNISTPSKFVELDEALDAVRVA
ncbi:MAG: hypothetical protein O3C60_07145 [Planctomycetota bacterium]|nr:hypothetical protein [Planctomycetota bacterium]